MTRLDWWLGVLLIVVALLVHALVPRYEWQTPAESVAVAIRIDRWTGAAEWGSFRATSNSRHRRWAPHPEAPQTGKSDDAVTR